MVCVQVNRGEDLPLVNLPTSPSCLVVDWNDGRESASPLAAMPGPGNVQPTGRTLPAIVCAENPSVTLAVWLMEQGALTVLTKPIPVNTFHEYVQQAVARDEQQMRLSALHLEVRSALQSLTSRQIDVLHCVVAGKPSKAIAQELGISKRLVELERSEILRVFGADATPNVTLKMGQYVILDQIMTRVDGPQSALHRHRLTSLPIQRGRSSFGADRTVRQPEQGGRT